MNPLISSTRWHATVRLTLLAGLSSACGSPPDTLAEQDSAVRESSPSLAGEEPSVRLLPGPVVDVQLTQPPLWAVNYRTDDAPSAWLEIAPGSGAYRSLPESSRLVVDQAHTAWLRGLSSSATALGQVSNHSADGAEHGGVTALWSTYNRYYYRGLDAFFASQDAGDPTILGGAMSVAVTLTNRGQREVALSDVSLTGTPWNGLSSPNSDISWQLTADPSEWTNTPLSACIPTRSASLASDSPSAVSRPTTLSPGASVDMVFCSTDLAADAVRHVLRRNSGISFIPRVEPSGVESESAVVVLTYGGLRPSESFRVAVPGGSTAKHVFDAIGVSYAVGNNFWSEQASDLVKMSGYGLVRVRDVSADPATDAYFIATLARGNSPVLVHNPHAETYDFDKIEVHPGDVLQVGFVVDADRDGLTQQLELEMNASDTLADSDGDYLDDALEAIGWTSSEHATELNGEPLDLLVDSDPSVPDTDGDGVDDWSEYLTKTDPRF